MTRANSFRVSDFEGMQFPKASKGRGRPPVKRKRKEFDKQKSFLDDSDDDGKSYFLLAPV